MNYILLISCQEVILYMRLCCAAVSKFVYICGNKYIHTYYSRFIPAGVAETSKILWDILRKRFIYEKYCRRDR
jgi:predicted membrane-bound dolichyl-phosphate-mannose-protein mannosyltransferase